MPTERKGALEGDMAVFARVARLGCSKKGVARWMVMGAGAPTVDSQWGRSMCRTYPEQRSAMDEAIDRSARSEGFCPRMPMAMAMVSIAQCLVEEGQAGWGRAIVRHELDRPAARSV